MHVAVIQLSEWADIFEGLEKTAKADTGMTLIVSGHHRLLGRTYAAQGLTSEIVLTTEYPFPAALSVVSFRDRPPAHVEP